MIRFQYFVLFAAALAGAGFAISDDGRKAPARENYTVHEWGTFTTLAGSDGVHLVGITHDDEPLPKFVYHYEKQEKGFNGVLVKMETPVIYFYSKEKRNVEVSVGFPKGVLTQWFPQVRNLAPVATGAAPVALGGGKLDWREIAVLAPGDGEKELLPVDKDNIWRFARETDANMVRVCGAGYDKKTQTCTSESERFLFYRGLGAFDLPIRARIDEKGQVEVKNAGAEPLKDIIYIRVSEKTISLASGGDLPADAVQRRATELPPSTVGEAMDTVAVALEKAGLYRKEARAMVNTWRKSYFETPGFRILYIIPRKDTDRLLPLTLDPLPAQLERVLVGRFDLLLPEDEIRAEDVIRNSDRKSDAAQLLGRFAEPIVRRIYQKTTDPGTRARAEALLGQFSTHDAAAASR